MSTIDPDAAWREHSPRRTTGASLLVPGLLLLGAGAVLAWALTRGAATGFSDDAQEQDVAAIIAAIASFFVLLIALGLWVGVASRNPRLPGWLTAVGIAVLGATVGHAVVALPPELLQDPVVDPLAFGLAIAAVALLGLGLVARAGRARRLDAADELVRTTTPVTGSVTNQGYTHFDDASRILTAVTYTFRDAAGQQRWVKRAATIDVRNPLVNGEEVDVWFDRQDPSDENRIVIRRRV
ncbi:DUF3592 domain-containing protein [Microbacterium azadirachtae]|uniref:Yip1 domain protein n=1 Tax=Microbacterium azadirachtae TaxID=582680 RepID=A0A0F0LLY0_9MICO|nr:DUF3592 domain-containing protein [Microbacterium azadirachtae]KJL34212.1 Yip1 domain protein [Microbacterium azadirachtae]